MATNFERDGETRPRSTATSRWVLLAVLSVMGMLNYAVRTSITAVYPLLKSDLGFTDAGLGAIGSLFLWSYALASPFAGHLGDRLNRGRIALWSLVGWSFVIVASGMANARWELLAMRVVLGLVESLYFPAAMALVAEYHTAQTRGTALGIFAAGEYLGLIGGPNVAGFLANHYGWRPSFWLLGIAGLVVAIPAFQLVPVQKPGNPALASEPVKPGPTPGLSFASAFAQLLKNPSFVVLAAAGVLSAFGLWTLLNWLPLYFKETLGSTQK